tara:strand:+ start:2821 stop:2934 length:114 start_codon:yes stop_codon:yes gene_type:complete
VTVLDNNIMKLKTGLNSSEKDTMYPDIVPVNVDPGLL